MLGKIFNFFRSFKPKIISAFIIVLVVPCIIIGSFSYRTAKNTVEEEILSSIKENISIMDSSIDQAIQPKIENVKLLSEKISSTYYKGNGKTELKNLLEQYGQYF